MSARIALASVALLALAACSIGGEDTQWKEVSTSSGVVEQLTQAEAAHQVEQFLDGQGYPRRGGDDAGGAVHRYYQSSSAPHVLVGLNNDASRYCFNFTVSVDAKATDAGPQASAIQSAFLSEFGSKEGWRLSSGACPVGE
ncbi:hypothetical protein LVB87_11100 [Lysobacter sp. KIS68-7]|uniref:hypothetical protein n=1 Tax=Lysobacter sp. KIS68-7 TaxID=2904252 RepID=UPI001E40D18C|nr:hypothetical protein [Lysobacter sp. KIS68-7]UHQ18732.1 hypothetical protein LVB87_11100 [Lysobacter sp. KIS68-7]